MKKNDKPIKLTDPKGALANEFNQNTDSIFEHELLHPFLGDSAPEMPKVERDALKGALWDNEAYLLEQQQMKLATPKPPPKPK